jgi:hypothetical protein
MVVLSADACNHYNQPSLSLEHCEPYRGSGTKRGTRASKSVIGTCQPHAGARTAPLVEIHFSGWRSQGNFKLFLTVYFYIETRNR